MESHVHHQGCGCAEEHKKTDPAGVDLFPAIELPELECFNERQAGSVRNIIRPIEEKMDFSSGVVESAYGRDLVVSIPFGGEVKVKALIVIGGDEGQAPSSVKLYKNVDSCDVNIIEERKAVQVLDLNPNLTGEVEYLVNVSKFNNTRNLVLGFPDNYGAPRTMVKFIGLKGERIMQKPIQQEIIYEVRANLADHKTPDDNFGNMSNLGS